MAISRAGIKGRVLVEVHDVRTGELIQCFEQENRVVNAGLNLFRDFIVGDSTTHPSHMAIGTGATAVTATDTTLDAQVDRNAFATETTSSTGIITWTGFWSSAEANGNTIAEAGIFNSSTGGTMSNRVVLDDTVDKDDTKSLTVTWTLTLTDNS